MNTPNPLPSFDQADFARADYANAQAPPDACAYCYRGLPGEYYRVDGHLACPQCAGHTQSLVPPDSHKAYSKALLYGMVTAALCCIAYALLEMTGFMIGYVAIGVGWAVAKAMMKASNGLGGRRYQWTAMLLTYAAISIAFMPVMFKAINNSRAKHATTSGQTAGTPASTPNTPATAGTAPKPAGGFGKAILAMALLCAIGLFSPFLKFFFSVGIGLFGLFFLFIGMQTAWRLTRRTAAVIDGPYASSATIPSL